MSDFYAYTDKILQYLRRYYVREFNRASFQIRSDQANVISLSKALYNRLRAETVRAFVRIAKKKYFDLTGEDTITEMWVLDFISTANPLTGYIWTNDIDRKRQYFVESVMSGTNIRKDADKALRHWYGAVKQYADLVTDAAAIKGFADTGTKFVEWVTASDERVCAVCDSRDGMIYPVKNVPAKPHYNCRCYYEPVKEGEDDED